MPQQPARRKRSRWLLTVVCLALVGVAIVAVRATQTDPAPVAVSQTTSVQEGAVQSTLFGTEQNADPVVDRPMENWRELVNWVNSNGADWYKQCLTSRNGVTWAQAEHYAQLVDQGQDLRWILPSNTQVSDDQAKQELRQRGVPNVDNLTVHRQNGVDNTRGIDVHGCQPWRDERSQVRVVLAVLVDDADPAKGIDYSRGVLPMCGNPLGNRPSVPPALPATPIDQPPPCNCTPPEEVCQPTGSPVPSNGLCPKYQPDNVDRNPQVPEAKARPSSDNQSEIAKGPHLPRDTPTGCQSDCDPVQPRPSTPTTKANDSQGEPRQPAPTTTVAPPQPAPTSTQPPTGGTPQH